MEIAYVDRGPVDDRAVTRLHEVALARGVTGDVDPWNVRLQRYSVAWVCAFADDELVGFVHACWDGGRHAFLLDTSVAPAHRGRGIGRHLVRRLRDQVAAAGCEWLHVDHAPDLAAFYRACGFHPTDAGLLRLDRRRQG